jgi:VCBS repeat-containing protein
MGTGQRRGSEKLRIFAHPQQQKPTVIKSHRPLNIFCSYAPEDEVLFKQLENHLSRLRRQKQFVISTRGKIPAGEVVKDEIIQQMKEAHIILLLLSPDFVASDEIWSLERVEAIKRRQNEEAIVIPVLLRPFDWEDFDLPTSLHDQKVLPKNARAVTTWQNQDEAFTDIAYNIRQIATYYEKTQKISWKPLGAGISLAAAVAMLAAPAPLAPGSNATPQHLSAQTHVPPTAGQTQRGSVKPSPSQGAPGIGGLIFSAAAILAAILTIILAILGALRAMPSQARVASPPVAATTATVTITPASLQVSNTFTIPATTGTPDSQHVQARILSATTPTFSQTVKATGQGMTSATSARGTVEIINGTSAPITIAANTSYACTDEHCSLHGAQASLHLVVDQTVTIPPYPATKYHIFGIPAHVQEGGTIGNFNASCSGIDCFDYSNNLETLFIGSDSAFTGGTDPHSYTYIQQSDIDNAANALISADLPGSQQAQQMLQPQIQANERTIGTPQCTPNTPKANHRVGDHKSTVTVSVNFTCTDEVYDYNGALSRAAQLLKKQAASSLGSDYALTGQIVPSVQSALLNEQVVTLLVAAKKGIWVYQISTAQQQAWAKLVAGQYLQTAQARLASQQGVAQVTIQLAGTNGQMLPKDAQKIKVVVSSVHGL